MTNYAKTNIGNEGRVELHETLSLTGAEISINNLPAGANVPFVHSHKTNEEVYGILSGKGKVIIDGEEITLTVGDWIRISPSAKRQFFAAEDVGISFVCVQTKENSLEKFTANDAVVYLSYFFLILFCKDIFPAKFSSNQFSLPFSAATLML